MISGWKLNWILLGWFWSICDTIVWGKPWGQSKETTWLSGAELWEVKVIILKAEITTMVLFSYWNTMSQVPIVIRGPMLVFKPHRLAIYWLYVVYSHSPIHLSIYKGIVYTNICNFTYQDAAVLIMVFSFLRTFTCSATLLRLSHNCRSSANVCWYFWALKQLLPKS